VLDHHPGRHVPIGAVQALGVDRVEGADLHRPHPPRQPLHLTHPGRGLERIGGQRRGRERVERSMRPHQHLIHRTNFRHANNRTQGV
jgi:hypothetical protein